MVVPCHPVLSNPRLGNLIGFVELSTSEDEIKWDGQPLLLISPFPATQGYCNLWCLLSQSRNPDVVPFVAPNQLFKGFLCHILRCLAGSCYLCWGKYLPIIKHGSHLDVKIIICKWLILHSMLPRACTFFSLQNSRANFRRHLLTEVGQKKVEVET